MSWKQTDAGTGHWVQAIRPTIPFRPERPDTVDMVTVSEGRQLQLPVGNTYQQLMVVPPVDLVQDTAMTQCMVGRRRVFGMPHSYQLRPTVPIRQQFAVSILF